jgi:ubiquinone/menaquinone biosynthesis C-methylase UbiE
MTYDLNARHRFLVEYRHIRHAEGRGSDDPSYYQALPYRDLTGRNAAMWAMRAKTYTYFENKILAPIEKAVSRPLDILDLGAGNGWMSYRLSLRKHACVALDIFRDDRDGLLAARHYPQRLPLVEAEFDRLPFGPNTFDLVVYNSSLHYSTDYVATLTEARRCLRSSGQVIVLDSPVYRRREHGEMMIAERHANFYERYGFRSDAMPSIEFLDKDILKSLADSFGLRWTIHRPWYGWQWRLRPLKARLKGRRPPSQFWILAGRFGDS